MQNPSIVSKDPSFGISFIASLKIPTPRLSCLALHSRSNALYAASMNEITVFDLATRTNIETFSYNESGSGLVKSIVFVGNKIFTAHLDSKIRVWESTPSKRHRLVCNLPTVGDRLRHCMLSRNYVQVRRHKKRLWVEHYDAVSSLAVSDDSNVIYSVSWDKCLKIWRMSDLRCLESINAHADAVNTVAVFGDSTVYTGSADGSIKVWERRNGEIKYSLTATLEKHKSAVNVIALNRDGSEIFSGGCDGLILAWERKRSGDSDQTTASIASSLSGHGGAVLCLFYVHNMLISGSSDRTVRIWSRGSELGYSCMAVLEGHAKPVKSVVAVSGEVISNRHNVSVFSGSLDGEIKVWNVTI